MSSREKRLEFFPPNKNSKPSEKTTTTTTTTTELTECARGYRRLKSR
jgi:hypothetical protein